MQKTVRKSACVGLFLLPMAAPLAAQDVLSLSLEELARLPVTAAAGYAQPQAEAPGTAEVIRAAQWEAMGAQSVYDVLEMVPGLTVVESTAPERLVVARGMQTFTNPQVLWMLDGLPFNRLDIGGLPQAFDKGLAGLARIEVIFGPVSAIHGSNAFSAVINLVSREAGTPGSSVGVRAGSFDTWQARAETGGSTGDWRWRLSLEGRATDGDRGRIIGRDVQTTQDALFGTQASLAPGPLPTDADVQEALLNLGWRNTSLQLWHWRNDAGGHLASGALDPGGRNESEISHVALQQAGDMAALQTHWELEGLFQRQQNYFNTRPLPPGAISYTGPNGDIDYVNGTPVVFPEGFIAIGRLESDRSRLALNLINKTWPGHTLRVGVGQEWQELRELESRRNFGPGVVDNSSPVAPLSPLPNLAGTPLSILPPVRRHLSFVALQDDWRLADTLRLNLGVRYDRYSDFGQSTNPRASLQWQATPKTSLRLGYGTAFRAPSFAEQNVRNNSALQGNRDLQAEELRSVELEVNHTLAPDMQLGFTAFQYDARRLIDYAPRPPAFGLFAQNVEGREGLGGTATLNWQPRHGAQLNASVTLWDVKDTLTDARVAFVPGHMAALNGWWEFAPHWTLGGSVKHVGDRPREAGDARPALDDNTWANLHLHTTALSPRLTLGLTVQNIGDADLRDPVRNNLAVGPFAPDDLPLAGRAVILEASYAWGSAPAEPTPGSPDGPSTP